MRMHPIVMAAVFVAFASTVHAQQCSDAEMRAASEPHQQTWAPSNQLYETQLAAQKHPVDIVVIGDSIAMMWREPYWSKRSLTMFNLGIGGDRAQNVLWRLQSDAWKPLNPKRVIIVLGTNNLAAKGTGRSCLVAAALKRATERVAEIWPSARIGVLEILPRGRDFLERDIERREVNAELRKLRGVMIISAEQIACEYKQPCPNYAPDNVHLSAAGYEFLTDLIQKNLP